MSGGGDCVEIKRGQAVAYFQCLVEDRVQMNLDPAAVKERHVAYSRCENL